LIFGIQKLASRVCRAILPAAPLAFFPQLPQSAIQWNPLVFAVFGGAGVKLSLLEIRAAPNHMPGFINPQP
jgi:hypothetical protein